MGRFSQAISEGDGISIVPILERDVAALAALAEDAGAEAVAVPGPAEGEAARGASGLPILVRELDLAWDAEPSSLRIPGADACILSFERLAEGSRLEAVHAALLDQGIDCAVEVRDEEELEEALERVDPEIILISERAAEPDEEDLERTLDLLPDVPAGKLVISESRVNVREQVIALERAGVDAVLVGGETLDPQDFSAALAELTGR